MIYKGDLSDQLEDLMGLHRLSRDTNGEPVPLANKARVMRHSPTLPVLTTEQEVEFFAPLQPREMKPPVAEAPAKSKIKTELDKIRSKHRNRHINNTVNKIRPVDMRNGGSVRKPN